MNQITLTLTLLFFLAMLSSQASTTPLHQTVPVLSGTNNQEEQLQRAIRDASQLSRTEQHVIINLLRLRLAAVQMQRDDFELGRDTLRQIDTDSPAALQASLLMAESYRLTGQPQEARSWFLRTAHHYPYRTATLDGLISAARDEQQHNPGLSAALYSEISRQSQYALDQLNQLHRGGNVDPMTIILPSPLDDEIRQALLRRCLQHPEHDLLQQTHQLKKSITAVLSLQQRHQTLAGELSTLGQTLERYQLQRHSLTQRLQAGRQQVESLKERLLPNDFSDEQMAIREAITDLQNQHIRLESQLAFIEQSRKKLPDISHQLEQQLATLGNKVRTELDNSHGAVTQVLEDAISSYRTELTNLMAEAESRRSELLFTSQKQN